MKRTKPLVFFVVITAIATVAIVLTAGHWFPAAKEMARTDPSVFWTAAGVVLMAAIAALKGLWNLANLLFPPPPSPPHKNPTRPPNEQIEALYHANLQRECQRYNLEDLDEERAEGRLRLTLDDVYQDQLVRLPQPEDQTRRRADAHLPKNPSRPLLRALNEEKRHVMIQGTVGSGKSSFVNHLATAVVRSRDQAVPGLPDRLAARPVVRLPLRELGTGITPDTEPGGLLLRAIRTRIQAHIVSEIRRNGKPDPDAETLPLSSTASSHS